MAIIRIKEGNMEVEYHEKDIDVDKIRGIIKEMKEAQKKEVEEAFK